MAAAAKSAKEKEVVVEAGAGGGGCSAPKQPERELVTASASAEESAGAACASGDEALARYHVPNRDSALWFKRPEPIAARRGAKRTTPANASASDALSEPPSVRLVFVPHCNLVPYSCL